VTSDVLAAVDFSAWEEPDPALESRDFLEGWLRYQRHEFVRKLRDLDAEQLVEWSIPPVKLSVLGLVRHMTQMEHGYLTWGIGGGERVMVYGEEDYAGGSAETVEADLRRYFEEVEKAEVVIAATPSLDSSGAGHRRPVGATLVKMIDEYALHAGQAHMLRFAALGEVLR
jgi:hypothetical protein